MQEMRVRSLGQEDAWRRKQQPTPVFLPRKSHGQRGAQRASVMRSQKTRTQLRAPQQQQPEKVHIQLVSCQRIFPERLCQVPLPPMEHGLSDCVTSLLTLGIILFFRLNRSDVYGPTLYFYFAFISLLRWCTFSNAY